MPLLTISTTEQQAFLMIACDEASASSTSLLSVLKAYLKAAFARSGSGKFVSQQMANGQQTMWQQLDAYSMRAVLAMWADLVKRYYMARTALLAAGYTTPTDEQVCEEMMTNLQPVYEMSYDFTDLRYEPESAEEGSE